MKLDAKALYSPNSIFLIHNLMAMAIMGVVYTHIFRYGMSFGLMVSKLMAMVILPTVMPVFSFCSGFYQGKGIRSGESFVSAGKALSLLIVGYVIFMPLCEVAGYLKGGSSLGDFLKSGEWFMVLLPEYTRCNSILWYVLALFIWRISAPIIVKIKYHMVLVFLIGISSCCMGDEWYRGIFRFTPFYFLGVNTDWEKIINIRITKLKYLSISALCASAFVCILFKFFWRIPFTPGDFNETVSPFTYFAITFAYYFLSVSCIFALISFFPGRKIPLFTKIGANCMTVYFFHEYIIILFEACTVYPLLRSFGASVLTVTLVQTAVFFFTIVVFSTDYLTRLVMNSTNFVYRNIFKG